MIAGQTLKSFADALVDKLKLTLKTESLSQADIELVDRLARHVKGIGDCWQDWLKKKKLD